AHLFKNPHTATLENPPNLSIRCSLGTVQRGRSLGGSRLQIIIWEQKCTILISCKAAWLPPPYSAQIIRKLQSRFLLERHR
ncbi:unnamed protein product, partial [Prunus brigantina]